ncbi:MAG: tetratricopeptide repeat protein [Treponema sp.]|jgi:tetratricopeptide (TPR) repeat protein|nr:tetratricopeptide repeat protein [Treponema sp.]
MSPDAADIFDRAQGSARVGDHEEAERLLKHYLVKEPDDRRAHLLLGATLAKEGKINEAADEFTTMLAKNPRDVEALNNLAVIYRRQDKLQDALSVLMEAIDIEPTRAEFHYNVGNIHKQLGNPKAASMAYARVVELNPEYVNAYNNLGTIYEQLDEYEKAYNMFRKGLSLDHNNPTLHFNYGVALEANGRLEDALTQYKAAVRSKPGWCQAMNNMGIIYFKQGQCAKAMDTFKRILRVDSHNAEAFNNMGVVQNEQGKTKEAVINYRRAIECDPGYVKAVVNLEQTLENSGDFADAVLELEKLTKLVPNSADLHCRLASLYLKLDRYPEAMEQSRAALEWEPENIQALRIQGATQRMMGNDGEAKKVFQKILSLDPGNYTFQLDLADIHFKHKEYKQAEARILAYLQRRPKDRDAKMLLARVYAAMGNRTHAVQIFEELARNDPNDTEALAAAAELHKDAGEVEKALRTADKLVNLQGKRATSGDLSDLNNSLSFYENAVKAYSSDTTDLWSKNLKLLSEAASEKDTAKNEEDLFLGSLEKAPAVDEETEALFIEDSEVEAEDEEDLFLEDEVPLMEEEQLPDLSLDHLAEGGGGYSGGDASREAGSEAADGPDYPEFSPEAFSPEPQYPQEQAETPPPRQQYQPPETPPQPRQPPYPQEQKPQEQQAETPRQPQEAQQPQEQAETPPRQQYQPPEAPPPQYPQPQQQYPQPPPYYPPQQPQAEQRPPEAPPHPQQPQAPQAQQQYPPPQYPQPQQQYPQPQAPQPQQQYPQPQAPQPQQQYPQPQAQQPQAQEPPRPKADYPRDEYDSLPIEEGDEEPVSLLDDGEETPEEWDEDIRNGELPGDEPVENGKPEEEPAEALPGEVSEGEEWPQLEEAADDEFEPETGLEAESEEAEPEAPQFELDEPDEFGELEPEIPGSEDEIGDGGEIDGPEDEPVFGAEESENLDALSPGALEEASGFEPEAVQNSEAPDAPVFGGEGEKEEKKEFGKDSIVGLMNYLKGLAGGLPDKQRENFMKSDARLSMEYVINNLSGKQGLLKELKQKAPERRRGDGSSSPPAGKDRRNPHPDREKVAGTLSYLGDLSSAIPDKNLFAALKQKVQSIMARIKMVTDKRKDNA